MCMRVLSQQRHRYNHHHSQHTGTRKEDLFSSLENDAVRHSYNNFFQITPQERANRKRDRETAIEREREGEREAEREREKERERPRDKQRQTEMETERAA
jgi:hypothetical protein